MLAGNIKRNVRAITFYREEEKIWFPLVFKVRGYWEPLGGGIESGEDEFSALRREIKEEIGRDVLRILKDTRIDLEFDTHKGRIHQGVRRSHLPHSRQGHARSDGGADQGIDDSRLRGGMTGVGDDLEFRLGPSLM